MKRLFTLALLFLTLYVKAQTAADIRSIDGLVAWFSADSVHLSDGNHVDTLYDKSGNERHAIQNTVANQPIFVETDEYINNQPTIYFDGNDGLSADFKETISQPNNIFVIWKQNNTNVATCFTGTSTSPCNQLYYNNSTSIYAGNAVTTSHKAPFNHSLFQANFHETTSTLYINGDLSCEGNVGNQGTNGLFIGLHAVGSMGVTGNISELLFINGILSSTDSSLIMNYLRNKYSGMQLNIENDIRVNYGFAPNEYTAICDWAQSFLWDDGTLTPNIVISDDKKHYLTVTDKFGFRHSDYVQVNYSTPTLPNDTMFCYGEKSYLDAYIPGEYTYLWNNGSTEPKIEITKSGPYKITITDKDGYQWSKTINVSIDEFAKLDILNNETSLCEGDTLTAWSNNDSSKYKFLWNTGNSSDKIAINTEGLYSLSITDTNGCILKDTTKVHIKGITPKIQIITDTAHAKEPTSFSCIIDNIDNSTITEYKWSFGDGYSASINNPLHKYNNAGIFSSSLKVTTDAGCFNTAYNKVKVLYNKNDLVKLSYPLDSQYVFSDSIIAIWKPIYKCDKYQIQVAYDKDFNDIFCVDTTSNSSYLIKNLEKGKSYYWRVRSEFGKFGPCQTFKYVSISQTSDLVAWFSADSVHLTDSNHIDTLYDKSGNERHAFQNVSDNQPTYVETDAYINNQPTISFNGNNGLTSDFKKNVSQPNTIFAIWKQNQANIATCFTGTSTTPCNQLYYKGSTSIYAGNSIASTHKAPFNHSVFQVSFNNDSSFLYINGILSCKGNAGNQGTNGLSIGLHAIGSMGVIGNISELIFINGILSSSDSTLIMDYLRDKYSGDQLILNDYLHVNYGFGPIEYTAVCDWAQSFLWDDGTTTPSITISDSKKHFLTVTDKFGFKHSDYIQADYPKIGILTDTLICLGDTITWDPDLSGPYYYRWSDGSTGKSMKIANEGKYWVVITDTAGYEWHSDTIAVKVDMYAKRVSLGNDTIPACVGNNIYLQTGFEETVGYLWSDGTKTDHIAVSESGIYSVTTTDSIGCKAHASAYINVVGVAPTPDFSFGAPCATRAIDFANKSHSNDNSAISSYKWSFGDGSSSENENPTHIYKYSGNYSLQLAITSSNGCDNVLKQIVHIDSLPKADFSPVQCCSFTTTQFTDRSVTADSYISSWLWAMNDTTFEERNPQTQYNIFGDQTVSLIVTTAHGCSDTLVRNINVMQGPKVDFTYSPTCVNTPVYFTNKTSVAMGLATNYTWTKDTVTFSTQKSPVSTFTDTGAYRITLTARQIANNCSSSASKDINISPKPRPIIIANDICEGQTSILTGINNEPKSKPSAWTWNIDTLPAINGMQANHRFTTNGKHKAVLTIVDSIGCTASYDTTINVHSTPVASFRPLTARGPVPFDAEFINNSDKASNYTWDFGDGHQSNETDACHTYNYEDAYTVQLIAMNDKCADTTSRAITAINPHSDLTLVSASAETGNGFISVKAIIANRSNFDITDIDIEWHDNLGHHINETITDTIKENKILQYQFGANIGESMPSRLEYICVSAQPASRYIDEEPADNEYCIILNNNEFTVCTPKPNPANSRLEIGFIVPSDQDVKIELFDSRGEYVNTLYDGPATTGFNSMIFDISRYSSGVYFYRINHEGQSKSQMIIISHN